MTRGGKEETARRRRVALSPWRLALASQTVEIAFTSAGHQRLGWHWVWTRIAGWRDPAESAPGTEFGGSEVGAVPGSVAGAAPGGAVARSTPGGLPASIRSTAVQTHPVLAGLAWGPVLSRSLTDPASDRPTPTPDSAAMWSRAVLVLSPVVASIGDRVFHFAVPLCLGAGLVVLGLHFSPWSVFWYPILWALFVLATAVWSWTVGIRGEESVADLLASRKLERYAQVLEAAGRFLLGEAFGWILATVGKEEGGHAFLTSLTLLVALTMVAWKRGLSPRVRLGLLLLFGGVFSWWIG